MDLNYTMMLIQENLHVDTCKAFLNRDCKKWKDILKILNRFYIVLGWIHRDLYKPIPRNWTFWRIIWWSLSIYYWFVDYPRTRFFWDFPSEQIVGDIIFKYPAWLDAKVFSNAGANVYLYHLDLDGRGDWLVNGTTCCGLGHGKELIYR